MRRTSSAREWMPSLRYTRVKWSSTVFGLRKRAAPTSVPKARGWMELTSTTTTDGGITFVYTETFHVTN
jgi:hypothetical protein